METWAPTIISVLALGLIFFFMRTAHGKMELKVEKHEEDVKESFHDMEKERDKNKERYLRKNEHLLLCQNASLIINQHITKVMKEFKNEIFKELRLLRTDVQNGNDYE